jgi:hypothetical protein
MNLPTTIDGRHIPLIQWNKNVICHRKLALDFICSHGRKFSSVKDNDFGPGRVGKLHAVTQKVKCTKTKGTVANGKDHYCKFIYYLNSIILWVLLFYEFNYLFVLNINLFFDRCWFNGYQGSHEVWCKPGWDKNVLNVTF